MQLSFFRKCPLFEKTRILPSLIVDAHVGDVARRGSNPSQNFTLHQSPLMSCLTSGRSPQDVSHHKPGSLSRLETQYFSVVELGETAVMWYM